MSRLIANDAARAAAQEKWLVRGMSLLDEGEIPSDWSEARLAKSIGMTRGALTSCWATRQEFDEALIRRYREDLAEREKTLRGILEIDDARTRLMALYAAARSRPRRDLTMNRWAREGKAGPAREAAAAAVAERDARLLDDLTSALNDLGLPRDEAEAHAKNYAHLFSRMPGEVVVTEGDFRAGLRTFSRAARARSSQPDDIPQGGGDVIVIAVTGGKHLTGEERRELERRAREFAARNSSLITGADTDPGAP